MGHDIQAIVNHNLNTSSIEAFAQDLSDRFNRTVQYGYFDGAFVKGFTEGSDKQVISGTNRKSGFSSLKPLILFHLIPSPPVNEFQGFPIRLNKL